jgi:hypothetical protein
MALDRSHSTHKGIALVAALLVLWLSTVGTFGHTDDFAGLVSSASKSKHTVVGTAKSVPAAAPCAACQWQANSVSGAVIANVSATYAYVSEQAAVFVPQTSQQPSRHVGARAPPDA